MINPHQWQRMISVGSGEYEPRTVIYWCRCGALKRQDEMDGRPVSHTVRVYEADHGIKHDD